MERIGNTLTLEDAYKLFKITAPNTKITYKKYRDICSDFNILAVEEVLLQGKKLHMFCNLSYLQIVRYKRSFNRPSIDWPETNKRKKEGMPGLVYYTDEYYMRWKWSKGRAKVKNKTAYKFSATRGLKGNKEKLVSLLKRDELAYLNFEMNDIRTRQLKKSNSKAI